MKIDQSTKIRLTVVLPSLRLYKSVGHSKILESLSSQYKVSVVIPENLYVTNAELDKNICLNTYQEGSLTWKINKFVLDVETFSLMTHNVSFETRIRMLTKVPLGKKLSIRNFVSYKSKYGILLKIANLFFIRNVTRKFLRTLGSIHPGLKRVCRETKPEILLCFSGGMYSGVENHLSRFGKLKKIPFFLVIDNWDNLSSKSILWEHPDLLGVWGPEMAIDAMEIHGVSKNQILQVGSSRVDLSASSNVPEHFKSPSPYVLFAGSGIQHIDEVDALLKCRMSLDKIGLSHWKIIYRPHPWMLRGSENLMDPRLEGKQGIELDIDIAEKGEDSFYNLDSLRHLSDLVTSCNFLIAGHSTVIVEALYSGKKILAFTGSDHELFSNVDSWSLYRHMERLRTNSAIIQCYQLEDLDDLMNEMIETKNGRVNLVPEIIPNFIVDYHLRILGGLQLLEKINLIK